MRIVAVADTHTFQADFASVPDGDVFVHAGDLLRAGTLEELAPVAEWIRSLPHRHKIVVAGNHDWCFQKEKSGALALFEGVAYLEDQSLKLEGLHFYGSPWQPAYNDWAYNLPRGAPLAKVWSAIPDETDVLITHGPPRGHGDKGPYPQRAGCEDLTARVQVVKPALHLFGHIHQDGGFTRTDYTCFANVTTWECERAPTVIDIDPQTLEVTEVHIPPRGTLG